MCGTVTAMDLPDATALPGTTGHAGLPAHPAAGVGPALDRLRTIGDPVLHAPTTPVDAVDAKLGRLVERMLDACRRAGGVGLAAPQIGVARRVFVAWLSAPDEVAGGTGTRVLVAVDPIIAERSGPVLVGDEGCLSIPGRGFAVPRHRDVVLEYTGLDGEHHVEALHGWDARVVQHECDHLDGVLIADVGDEV